MCCVARYGLTMAIADKITWRKETEFEIASFVYREQPDGARDTAPDAFHFYKNRAQIEQFDRFFAETGFVPKRVLELGIWDGGSAAFWPEVLQLQAYAAIDIQERGDSGYFTRWLDERGRGCVSTHWGVDQTSEEVLRVIHDRHLDPLDLILDDCSHMYDSTLRSFEMLFGRVRPGGWYIIEDWAWSLQPEYQSRHHAWAVNRSLHPITHRLVDLHGSRPDVVPSLRMFPDFIAIERGSTPLSEVDVESMAARRRRPWGLIAYQRARAVLGRARRQLRM